MGWNAAYWQGREGRAREAREHHSEMLQKYPDEIKKSIQGSVCFDGKFLSIGNPKTGDPSTIVENLDTVSAILKYAQNSKTVALNFASYRAPGGGYLTTASAKKSPTSKTSIETVIMPIRPL